jgi:ubiquitin carboxyl-terminal hydrolase 10
LPAVPVIPALPKAVARDTRPSSEKVPEEPQLQNPVGEIEQTENKADTSAADEAQAEEVKVISPPPNAWAKPKAWAGLFNATGGTSSSSTNNGGLATVTTFGKSNSESLAETLKSFNAVSNDSKIAFLEPRGLVNTGNMCYMNSVGLF